MKLTEASLLFLAGSATALPSWGPWQSQQAQAQAVYVQTNDASGNSIVAMQVGSDGSLSGGQLYATGGNGGNLIKPATGEPAYPDALSVQDSVVTDGKYLFVVNAGSNTVSMFSISSSDPTQLQLMGSPQSSNGYFPVSLAVAPSLNTICVSNTGAPSGVACASYSSEGLSSFDALRYLYAGQPTNPPLDPVPGVGDLFFSEDYSQLILTVKGNGTMYTGYIATYAVADGKVSTTAYQATPPKSGALFGSATIPGSSTNIYVSDASFGALILDLNDLAGEPVAITNVTGQKASCWAEVSTFTGTGFITDIAVNRLVETNLQDGSIITEYYPPNLNSGMGDFAIMGTYIWTLSANNGTQPASITTFDISGGPGSAKQVFEYAIPGAIYNTMGLVVV